MSSLPGNITNKGKALYRESNLLGCHWVGRKSLLGGREIRFFSWAKERLREWARSRFAILKTDIGWILGPRYRRRRYKRTGKWWWGIHAFMVEVIWHEDKVD
jgi:hypothetical protein